MSEKFPEQKWVVGDCTSEQSMLELFPPEQYDGYYDLVIDKGTLDAISCGDPTTSDNSNNDPIAETTTNINNNSSTSSSSSSSDSCTNSTTVVENKIVNTKNLEEQKKEAKEKESSSCIDRMFNQIYRICKGFSQIK